MLPQSPVKYIATMSSDFEAPKLGLDARAAELKEKLLRSRSQLQSQVRVKSAQPSGSGPVTPVLHAAATAPTEAPPASQTSESVERQCNTLPDKALPRATIASLPADDNDIAALISSISAAVTQASDAARKDLENQDKKEAIVKAESASGPSTLLQKPHTELSIPSSVVGAAQNKAQTLETTEAPTPSPIKTLIESGPKQATDQNNHPATAGVKMPSRRTTIESPKQGEATTTKKGGVSAASTAPGSLKISTTQAVSEIAAPKDSKKSTRHTERSAVGNRSLQATETSGTSRELIREHPQSIPTRSPASNPPDSEAKPHTDVPMRPLSTGRQSTTIKSTNGNHTGSTESLLSDDALARILDQVPDLKDFLEMTDYFNVEARTRKLDRFRRAKALAAEKQRIEEEERKLREEEELDMDLQRSNMARLTGAASVLESNSLPTPVTPLTKSLNDDDIRTTPLTNATKRARDPETSPEARQDKVPRLGAAPQSRPKDIEDRTRGDDRRHWHESDRGLSPRHNNRYRQSSPANPPYRQENDSEDRRKYDRYKGGDGRYRELERPQSYPIHVDLGRKGGKFHLFSFSFLSLFSFSLFLSVLLPTHGF